MLLEVKSKADSASAVILTNMAEFYDVLSVFLVGCSGVRHLCRRRSRLETNERQKLLEFETQTLASSATLDP